MRLRRDGVDREEKVVGGDGACDVRGKVQDAGDCVGGGGVFEDDSEVGEFGGEAAEVGEKVSLGVENGNVLVVNHVRWVTASRLKRSDTDTGYQVS